MAGDAEIVLLPVGDTDPAIVARIAARVGAALDVEVVAGQPQLLPEGGFDRRRSQYRSSVFLESLDRLRRSIPNQPRPYLLGVAAADLFVPRLNFIFGEADHAAGVAVISLARLRPQLYGRPADPPLLEERAFKEAIHEIGHVYGLLHCRDPRCIMLFSNTIEDTDRKGPGFCPDCERQLLGLLGRRSGLRP